MMIDLDGEKGRELAWAAEKLGITAEEYAAHAVCTQAGIDAVVLEQELYEADLFYDYPAGDEGLGIIRTLEDKGISWEVLQDGKPGLRLRARILPQDYEYVKQIYINRQMRFLLPCPYEALTRRKKRELGRMYRAAIFSCQSPSGSRTQGGIREADRILETVFNCDLYQVSKRRGEGVRVLKVDDGLLEEVRPFRERMGEGKEEYVLRALETQMQIDAVVRERDVAETEEEALYPAEEKGLAILQTLRDKGVSAELIAIEDMEGNGRRFVWAKVSSRDFSYVKSICHHHQRLIRLPRPVKEVPAGKLEELKRTYGIAAVFRGPREEG